MNDFRGQKPQPQRFCDNGLVLTNGFSQGDAVPELALIDVLLPAAEQGHVDAQYRLGLLFEFGDDAEKDFKESFKWYLEAAKQGILEAQYRLGVCFKRGRGTEKSFQEAIKWYRKSIEQSYADKDAPGSAIREAVLCPMFHGSSREREQKLYRLKKKDFYGDWTQAARGRTRETNEKNGEKNVIVIKGSDSRIWEGAYSGRFDLGDIIIDDSITEIGNYAFADCLGLVSVTLPCGIKTIEVSTFENCIDLASIAIPEGVTEIKERAFYNCMGLTSIIIPSTVKAIRESAFSGCSSLNTVIIRDGVKIIDWSAFSDCESLASLVIPSSVTTIREGAFSGCNSLTTDLVWNGGFLRASKDSREIVIPDGISYLDDYSFADCTNLTSIVIPDSVKAIGEGAFSGCTSLSSISIPKSVLLLDYAFRGCTSLKSVSIPRVKEIGDYAFSGCTNLSSIEISKRVALGNGVFNKCPNLPPSFLSELENPTKKTKI